MKNLMIATIVAAMTAGAYANTCVKTKVVTKDPCTGEKTVDYVEGAATAHKVAISLKTTANKAKKIKQQCSDAACTYWRQQATKKINGAIWAELDDCNGCTMTFEDQQVALWDADGAIDAEFAIGVGLIGKNVNSKTVEAYGTIAGDEFGELAYGAFGTVVSSVKKNQCSDDDCSMYVKSLSGGIAGKLVAVPYEDACADCDPIVYEGCCDDVQLEYTAAYGTIKISYDAALAKKVIAYGDDAIATIKGAPAEVIASDIVIEE